MRVRLLILLLLLLGIVSCEGMYEYSTNTPAPQPSLIPIQTEELTPTQEIQLSPTPNPEAMDCLTNKDHSDHFYDPNPCLWGSVEEHRFGGDQVRPVQYELVFTPSPVGQTSCVDMWKDEEGIIVDATMCSGGLGLAIPWIRTDNSCNMLIVHADSTINVPSGEENAAAVNFYLQVTLHPDFTNEFFFLGGNPGSPIADEWQDAFELTHYNLSNQDKEYLFPFYFEDTGVYFRAEVSFYAIYASGNHGSTFRFRDIILVRGIDWDNCRDVNGF